MTYQVLARKWRPKIFDDVIGQQHIARSLQNSLKSNQLGHAYLFSGTRGVGKTSVARIFAKAIRCSNRTENGNPCNSCSSCQDIDKGISMDVIEMDAASNNGVDDVKNLLETTQTMPMFGGYKIYIIDEIHMLSTSAFNALLKTLEEPPEHVIFIFATTEPERLIDTVRSRCQRFDFRHVLVSDLVKHLQFIAEQEGIQFSTNKLLEQIAELGQGSVRDMLSIMDQVLSFSIDKIITEETVVTSLGIASSSALRGIVSSLIQGEAKELSKIYHQLLSENVDVQKIIYGVLDHLYRIIDHVDDANYLESEQLISPAILEGVNFAELFWLFEILNQDSQWALKGFDPVKTVDLCLQKVALRRNFYAQEGVNITYENRNQVNTDIHSEEVSIEKKTKNLGEVLEEALEQPAEYLEDQVLSEDDSCLTCGTPIIEDPQKDIERNWENFLEYVDRYSPGGRARLEQGDIKVEPVVIANMLEVELCFKNSASIFYEHLVDRETKGFIVELLAKFYGVEIKQVSFKLTLLPPEEAKDFSSRAEKKDALKEQEREQIKENLKNDELVLKAEELFSASIDHIKIADE